MKKQEQHNQDSWETFWTLLEETFPNTEMNVNGVAFWIMENFNPPTKKLDKAIRDYPIGTKHRGISGIDEYFVTETPIWLGCEIFGGDGIIYSEPYDRWAKIVSKPEVKVH